MTALRYTRERLASHYRQGWHEVAHWLYAPAVMGRRAYQVRFPVLHRIHLIPASWMERSCDRFDRRLGLTEAEIRRTGPTER